MLMRAPCRWCLSNDGMTATDGTMQSVNGQDVVRCARCGRHCYNAPRSETGKPQRHVRSRPDLKLGQRERILTRDGNRCLLCGIGPDHGAILHVSHAMSVEDGRRLGVEDEVLFDDDNLFASCEECNLSMGAESVPARIFLRLIHARLKRGLHT